MIFDIFKKLFSFIFNRNHFIVNNTENKVFVGNLSFNTTYFDLQDAFNEFGKIIEIKVPTDRYSGRMRGFAFITFETQQAVKNALAANGKEINGRAIRISMANKKKGSGNFRKHN